MRKKNSADVFDMIAQFQLNVLSKKPSAAQMYDEVRLMRFKIRPLNGEITTLDLNNNNFIEMLWGLGKLDEFYQIHIEKLPQDQRQIFFRIFDELYQKFQQELNRVNLKREEISQNSTFEMEIFKDKTKKFN
jgi:hypothetical protein